jgi:putative membrane protein
VASWDTWLEPWEFSPTVAALCVLALVFYVRGLVRSRRAGMATGVGRPLAFVVGLVLIYAVLQTYFDYLAQHMFWVHRLQHLVLHHVGPFLIALAAPQAVLSRGVPHRLLAGVLTPLWRNPLVRGVYRVVQHPLVAPTLFVGLIYFWLLPSVHFDAMLSLPRYNAMNWGMAIDGLLFWWLMLGPAPERTTGPALGYGARILVLALVMFPQIALGAYITFAHGVLYDVYAVCGRAWNMGALFDQQIGGLITWIPSSMMSVVAALVLLRRWMMQTPDAAEVHGRASRSAATAPRARLVAER